MVRIKTTHIWTILFIPICWVSRLIAIVIVLSILGSILPESGLASIVYLVAIIGTFILHGMYIEQWYHVIQTWLYIRINLKTRISLFEAKNFLLLFAPTENGSWYPMTGIKEIPKEYRKKILYQSARKIYMELGYEFAPESIDSTLNKEPGVNDKISTSLPPNFSCLVGLLSKLAKSDGIVSREEIDFIMEFINFADLNNQQREEAIDLFKIYTQTDIPFEVFARDFYNYHKDNNQLLESVIIIMAKIACSDGDLSSEEEILISQAISIFNVDESIYEQYKASYCPNISMNEKDKYYANILGLKNDLSPSTIKSSYRKLAFKYHPDKVSHLGDKIRDVAEQEMKKINEAYDYFQKRYNI